LRCAALGSTDAASTLAQIAAADRKRVSLKQDIGNTGNGDA
jgi:hypothetical protein